MEKEVIVLAVPDTDVKFVDASNIKLESGKADVAHFTENAMTVATVAAAMLLATRCPIVGIYKVVEQFVQQSEAIRRQLGLSELDTQKLFDGRISKKAKQALLEGLKKQIAEMEANGEADFKSPFSFPAETDTKKMN